MPMCLDFISEIELPKMLHQPPHWGQRLITPSFVFHQISNVPAQLSSQFSVLPARIPVPIIIMPVSIGRKSMRFWVYAIHLLWLNVKLRLELIREALAFVSLPQSVGLWLRPFSSSSACLHLFSLFFLAWLRISQIAFSCLFLCAVTRIPNYFWIISFIYVPHCLAEKFRCSSSVFLLSSVSQLVAYLFSFLSLL